MSKRFLSLFFVLTLLVGGAAACGDDSGDDGGSDSSSDDSGDSGNAEVQAYCDQVADFADEVAAADSDPELVALEATGEELSQAAADLSANAADLTTEDADALADCSQEVTDILAEFPDKGVDQDP